MKPVVSAGPARYSKPEWSAARSLANRVVPRSLPFVPVVDEGIFLSQTKKEARMQTIASKIMIANRQALSMLAGPLARHPNLKLTTTCQ